MSILSKIFIVLLVVLSIAVSVMTMLVQRDVLAPREERALYKQQAEDLKLALEDTRRVSDETITNLRDKLEQAKAAKETSDQAAKIATDQIQPLVRELKEAKVEIEINKDRANKEVVESKAKDDLIKIARDERDLAQKAYNELYVKNNEVSLQADKFKKERDTLLDKVELLLAKIDALQEQIYSTPIASTTTGQPGGTTENTPSVAVAPIKAKITAVANDNTMATIDRGANDGVVDGMKFDVFRAGRQMDRHADHLPGRRQDLGRPAGDDPGPGSH